MAPDLTTAIDEHYDKWLPRYRDRAREVEAQIGRLFQEAISTERPGDIVEHQGVTTSLTYLQRAKPDFAHPLVLFIYSSRYNADFEKKILNPSDVQQALPDGLTSRKIFERKVERFKDLFKAFTMITDSLAEHYVCALMSEHQNPGLPLVWEVPASDETSTEVPPDAMWWTSFQFLCEIAHAIFAYGGMTPSLYQELVYIRGRPDLSKRLLWLDQDLQMYFPDRDEETWKMTAIADVLGEIDR